MAITPNTDNYTLGKGVVFFDQLIDSVYQGERDLGNAPAFTFNIALEKLEHFSSRGGLKAKDKEVISQITPGITFTLDEVNKENLSLLTLGDVTTVTQAAGQSAAEDVTANLGLRSDLDFRGITYWNLPYNDALADNVIFVVGEVVTGAGGATGTVLGLATGSTATAGTLYISRTNAIAFVDAEALTGDGTGAAEVNSATGGTLGTGTPYVLIQDDVDTVTYVAGTDYEIDTTLSDDSIGRIRFLSGGTVTEGETVHVTYGYSALTYTNIAAFANTQINGKLRFVSDNPAGNQQELMIWSVSLTPSGETAMIGEDWSTLGFTGEILKDETNHPLSPYMDIIMDQALT
jgi:hypothetical protein